MFRGPEAVSRLRPTAATREDAFARVVAGGYPEAFTRPNAARRRWYSAYLRTVTERDVVEISRVQDAAAIRRLLRLLAARTAQELNLADLGRDLQTPRSTIAGHLALLETLYLVQRLPAWSRNLSQRVVRHPKAHLVDAGMAAALVGADEDALGRPGHPALGPLLETFVVGEVRRQASWLDSPPELYHFREHQGPEVDLVLEAPDGRVVGVEVKASSSVTGRDFAGLDRLAGTLGPAFCFGVVLYLGDRTLPFGDRRAALPISVLWS
jgi:hypothetical protein